MRYYTNPCVDKKRTSPSEPKGTNSFHGPHGADFSAAAPVLVLPHYRLHLLLLAPSVAVLYAHYALDSATTFESHFTIGKVSWISGETNTRDTDLRWDVNTW